MTLTPLSRSKGQGHYAALLSAALIRVRQHAALSVATYWPSEPIATLRSALCRRGRIGGARRFGAHRGRRGRGHTELPLAYSFVKSDINSAGRGLIKSSSISIVSIKWPLRPCDHKSTICHLISCFHTNRNDIRMTLGSSGVARILVEEGHTYVADLEVNWRATCRPV